MLLRFSKRRIATTFITIASRHLYTHPCPVLAFAPSPLSILPLVSQVPQLPSTITTATTSPFRSITNTAFTTTTRKMSTSKEDTDTTTSATTAATAEHEDPYIWLEEVESEESLKFATEANAKCLSSLGDPKTSDTKTYENVLSILESDDRIAYVSHYGYEKGDDDDVKNEIMMNLWKDSKNPKGLWRKTTLESYKSDNPQWETVLDIDELAKKRRYLLGLEGCLLPPHST